MKKKIIISVVAAVVCIAVFTTVIIINLRSKTAAPEADSSEAKKSVSELLSEGKAENNDTAADFGFEYPDRLGGYQATDMQSNSSMIEITYSNAGFVRKTYAVSENSGDKTEYDESMDLVIDGSKVTFKGNDGMVNLAVWNENNYAYTISVNEGVSPEDMEEYVKTTR